MLKTRRDGDVEVELVRRPASRIDYKWSFHGSNAELLGSNDSTAIVGTPKTV